MSDYREFIESRLMLGEDTNTIVRKVAEAAKCPVCPFCNERPATLLCDFVIGFEWKGKTAFCNGEEYRVAARKPEMFTCDRPICADCATNHGFIHYSGKESGVDSQDHCPQCEAEKPNEEKVRCGAIAKAEAIAMREKMWKRSIGQLREIAFTQ